MCQSYIHTLRWKDRPLQCPRCQSHNVGPWGTYHYQPGLKRYRCKEKACKRTFNDLTGTLLDGSKRSVCTGFSRPFCCACRAPLAASPERWGCISGRAIAGAGGCAMPPCPTRWQRQLEGTVEADDLYHTAGQKGQAKQGGKKALGRTPRGRRKKREPGRGHYDKDRPAIIAWVSRQGASSSRRHGILRSRRCRRPPTSPYKPAASSTRTRPAAIGR